MNVIFHKNLTITTQVFWKIPYTILHKIWAIIVRILLLNPFVMMHVCLRCKKKREPVERQQSAEIPSQLVTLRPLTAHECGHGKRDNLCKSTLLVSFFLDLFTFFFFQEDNLWNKQKMKEDVLQKNIKNLGCQFYLFRHKNWAIYIYIYIAQLYIYLTHFQADNSFLLF